MSNKWGCWSQKVKGQCYMRQITILDDEIAKMKRYLGILENKEKCLKQALESSNFAELLKVKGSYLDAYASLPPEMDEVKSTRVVGLQEICSFTPTTCAGTFWYKSHLKERLKVNLNKAIDQYNQLLSLCLQLQYFYAHTTSQAAYAHYFFKLIETEENMILLCSAITQFLKGLPEQNQGKFYLFTSDTTTQVAPESYLEFKYAKGTLYINHMQIAPMHRNLEVVLLSGLEEFATLLSSYLSNKRYLPISTLQGQLGLEKYASRATLLKAYLKNNFTPQGKSYPDGTYLPHQIMLKNI